MLERFFFGLLLMYLIKFSFEDCGICYCMSYYDGKVVEEFGCSFIFVMLQDMEMYWKYWKILFKQYFNKEGMGWFIYLLVNDFDGDFLIEGELKGGMFKGDFCIKLVELLLF